MTQLNEIFQTEAELEPFDIESSLPAAPVLPTEGTPALTEQNVIDDLAYARDSMKHLSQRSQQLVEVAMEKVVSGGGSREVEAANQCILTASQLLERLMQLHGKSKEALSPKLGTGNTFVQNQQVVCSSTAELLSSMTEPKEKKRAKRTKEQG